MASIHFSGLVTGLDTDKIIQGLLDMQQRRIQKLNARKDQVLVRQNALAEVENRLRALQDSLFALARSHNTVFEQRQVRVNYPELASATASSQATPGTYSFQVLSIARPHQLASQGFDSPDSPITTGTLTIRMGQSNAVTLTIDQTNNTLRGLAAAINAAQAGVTAAVIHDGSPNHTQPYRLLVTAQEAGANNFIQITNQLASDTGPARKPVFDASYIGPALAHSSNTSTSFATSNQGPGAYTGATSKSYYLTVLQGGTVGSDTITLRYEDSTGNNYGLITLGAGDTDVYKNLAEGVMIKFSSGVLNTGDKFTIDVFAPQIQAPTNARLRLGSGDGALLLESGNNTWNNLFEGVQVTIHGADVNRNVQLQVVPDIEKMRQAISAFVDKYNELISYLNQHMTYDAQTQQVGPLFGNRVARQIRGELQRLVSEAIPGLPSQLNRLSALGISLTQQGTLEIDNQRLNRVLTSQVPGITLDDVRRLFAFVGQSNHAGVKFVAGSLKTVSPGPPIQVDITQVAEQASVLAAQDLATNVILSDSNNQLSLILDGKLYHLTLTPGSYSRQALAEELQARVNAVARQEGRQVTVTLEGNRLRIRSDNYGSHSEVHLVGGNALASLGFTVGQRGVGQDVAGVFLVQGETEPARGVGQLLVGDENNRATSGLQVRVSLTPSQLVSGPEAEIVLTRGMAAKLDQYLHTLFDPQYGLIRTGRQVLQSEAQRLQESIDRISEQVRQQRQTLEKRFRDLEHAVSRLRGLGEILTAQFQALINHGRPNRR